jgi:hypothetical protein
MHTNSTYQRRVKQRSDAGPSVSVKSEPASGEEEEVKAALIRAQAEVQEMEAILEDFRLKRVDVAAVAARVEAERRRVVAAGVEAKRVEEAEEAAERKRLLRLREQQARGTKYTFSLPHEWHTHVAKTFGSGTLSVALSTDGIMMLHDNGGGGYDVVGHAGHIPDQLMIKLRGRKKSLPNPVYVSMGSEDRYFVKFADGTSQWNRIDEVKPNHGGIATVAFGEDGAWFSVYEDGWWDISGSVPEGLIDIINKRKNRADLACVTLGPTGEWFLRAKNSKVWWGGLSDENTDTIRSYKDRITNIIFGNNDNFFLRYE